MIRPGVPGVGECEVERRAGGRIDRRVLPGEDRLAAVEAQIIRAAALREAGVVVVLVPRIGVGQAANVVAAVTEDRDTSDNDTDSATTDIVASGKTLLSTTESWTSDTAPIEAAIGELLTYRATFDIPGGVTREDGTNPIITDTLPSGLTYQTGTATIRAVADTTIAGANLSGGLDPIPSSATAITPTVNGQVLEFDLGDITNNDADANTEQIILEYQVLVVNTSDNGRTNTKVNTAALNYTIKSIKY